MVTGAIANRPVPEQFIAVRARNLTPVNVTMTDGGVKSGQARAPRALTPGELPGGDPYGHVLPQGEGDPIVWGDDRCGGRH
ncbi:hypothetical protein GCM10012285_15540 [Streptomyces kronopolitis]|uniref:Uncharacterized protein n=1 Tax=Streptomyces kronopolitis TaxID=1612435 RepID=A0ABQ2J757_9ACTN|nr:hypothetical protein GCM10012285_15540 [Streptomyces kronopolitis]